MRSVDENFPAEMPSEIALLTRYGSPLYVYDAEEIRRRYRAFVEAFPHRPLELHYAIVCNKNPCIVQLLSALGAGVHANTPGDAFCALRAGIPKERIVYSGTNLNQEDFAFLLEHGIRLHLDSLDQLRSLAELRRGGEVGIRLLIDDPARPNRIGVTPDELDEALQIAKSQGIRVAGLHMYAGTNTRRAARFLECLDRLLTAARTLPDLAWIEVGGGFGVAYKEDQSELDLDGLGLAISHRIDALSRELGRALTLVIEPGRTLVGTSGSLLMTVVSVKERGGRRFIGVDSTVGNIVVPSVYHAHHRVQAVAPRGADLAIPTDVCGNTTHSRDYLGRNLRLPALTPGDVLRIRDVGAYGYAMSSHFLNRPRPAEIVIDGPTVHLTTRRETFADLVATQVLS
jgi:diaminopimelate decarboxylase